MNYFFIDFDFQRRVNVTVINAENGVKFDVTNGDVEINHRKRNSSTHSCKAQLYKSFVKSATLTYDKNAVREVPVECGDALKVNKKF